MKDKPVKDEIIKTKVPKEVSAKEKDKERAFKVKIADLLNETGSQDELVFENKMTDQLPTLDARGVSGVFTVQSLDKTSLLGTLADVTACFHETCESCGISFDRPVIIPLYTSRFVFESEFDQKASDESDEVVLFIDPKAETINIEDMVVQSILLNDPFVKRCATCLYRLANVSDDDEDFEEYETRSNIHFS